LTDLLFFQHSKTLSQTPSFVAKKLKKKKTTTTKSKTQTNETEEEVEDKGFRVENTFPLSLPNNSASVY